jgi:hypothetical protein
MTNNQEIQKEEKRLKRREKKRTPKMRVSGRGMKRFSSTKKSLQT